MRWPVFVVLWSTACWTGAPSPESPKNVSKPLAQPPPGDTNDNDGDGIANADDLCPNDPEDLDGFEDEDGCPDPDNDKDRLLDVHDKCPNEPEAWNGRDDDDGCPDRSQHNIIGP